jgi:type I restriction-modification system DNA methylase subunit
MALEKSELYSSLWSSCDELRGGMDASQYKDYVLVLLFIKYVSDKYAGQPYSTITVPKGASFRDMVAEIAALETKPVKARNLKLGMMQELLTGRIRLI